MKEQDIYFMEKAIAQAEIALTKGLAPFGAVVVGPDGQLIAEGYNQVSADFDGSAHGEIIAIRHAGAKLKKVKLEGCTLYTSCEPCLMCTALITRVAISRVVYAARATDVPERKTLLDLRLKDAATWINAQPGWQPLAVTEDLLRERALPLFDNYKWT